ncbi:MAG: flagellar assembly protein T N-terminal domain-containing protein [bacterium]
MKRHDYALTIAAVLVLIVAAGTLRGATSAAEEAVTVEVEGVATIRGGDTAAARDEALEDAKRKAVEQGVGTYIESTTVVEGLEEALDEVYARAEGFVKSYEITGEEQTGTLYKTVIRAETLPVDAVREIIKKMGSLCFLQERWHKPRVMVLMSETVLGRRSERPFAESEIVKRLKESCFTNPLDSTAIERIQERDMAREAVRGNERSAQLVAQRYDSEFLIIGEAAVEECTSDINPYDEEEDEGLSSCTAALTARVVNVTTGVILADDQAIAPGIGISDDIGSKRAIQSAGEKLVRSLVGIMAGEGGEARNVILIKVSGADFIQFKKIKDAVAGMRGTRGVVQRGFESGGLSTLEAESEFSPEVFAEKLSELDLGRFKLEITGFSGSLVETQVK